MYAEHNVHLYIETLYLIQKSQWLFRVSMLLIGSLEWLVHVWHLTAPYVVLYLLFMGEGSVNINPIIRTWQMQLAPQIEFWYGNALRHYQSKVMRKQTWSYGLTSSLEYGERLSYSHT
jgi:hypothetical protein